MAEAGMVDPRAKKKGKKKPKLPAPKVVKGPSIKEEEGLSSWPSQHALPDSVVTTGASMTVRA
ncbi:hypothetical protein QP381_09325, partial [Pauljensenia sp. UMB6358]